MARQFRDAVRKTALNKRVTCHTLLGHVSVETTMIYLHVMKHPGAGAPSPLDLD